MTRIHLEDIQLGLELASEPVDLQRQPTSADDWRRHRAVGARDRAG
jgi:hypothetical protein